MNRLNGYVLTELFGSSYLLPYGQNIAAFKHGLRLNETGTLICRALLEGKTKEELPSLLAAHFEAEETELPALKEDVDRFLEQLQRLGIFGDPSPRLHIPSETFQRFRIGTVILQLNIDKDLISDGFLPFALGTYTQPNTHTTCDTIRQPNAAETGDTPSADLSISVRFGQPPKRPVGEVLVYSEELLIIEAADCYNLVFLSSPDLIACQIDKNGQHACFYCRDRASATLREELFHGIRFAFLYTARQRGLYAIHSASILYKEKAWLFSAPSGTGKSTHAKLWQELYDAPPLNGDLNLIGIADGKPVVYGLPWCGTSGIFTTETYPLGGVIFLRQDKMNTVQALTPDTCALMLSQRIISPTWTKEMLLSVLTFCEQATPLITCFELRCTPQAEAASVCRAAIDAALTGSTVH